jgi:hypothetical protein
MAAEQPDWLKLPFDLLEPIAQRSRDAVTGLDTFRSVCRTWRSAVTRAAAPRLLLPVPQNGAEPLGGSKYTLVFPLSRGWSIVVDVRDASCHLKHLPTGATAALPKLNAVRDSLTSEIAHMGYEHAPESDHEEVPFPDEDGSSSTEEEAPFPDEDRSSSTEEEASCTEDTSGCGNPDDEVHDGRASGDDWYRQYKLKIEFRSLEWLCETYLNLSDVFNFALHVPPADRLVLRQQARTAW